MIFTMSVLRKRKTGAVRRALIRPTHRYGAVADYRQLHDQTTLRSLPEIRQHPMVILSAIGIRSCEKGLRTTPKEAVMLERTFEFLFALALVAPPATVIISVLLLAWPRHRVHAVDHTVRTTSHA